MNIQFLEVRTQKSSFFHTIKKKKRLFFAHFSRASFLMKQPDNSVKSPS